MITKQCQFAGRDTNGEYIHVLQAGYDNALLTKTASAIAAPPQLESVQRFMRRLPKQNGRVYTLISALGAGEYWSSNSNADYFSEEALLHVPPDWSRLPYEQQRTVGKQWEWGYPTFYNANLFAHHQNKDPKRAFGTVEYVMWDTLMKRVLLIVAFDRERAARFGATGVLDKIENGEYASISMGCRVPYDTCSICADWTRITKNPRVDVAEHRRKPIRGLSTVTADYCTHLKNELNKIYPDGRKVMMLNIHPRFFDVSVVFIGADKTSFVLAKLAGQCPIQPGTRACGNCSHTDCVPSAHIAEVWDRGVEKMAAPYAIVHWDGRTPDGRPTGGTYELTKAQVEQRQKEDDERVRRGEVLRLWGGAPRKAGTIKTAQGLEEFEWEDPKTETRINDYLKKKRMQVGRIKTSALSKDAEIVKQIQSNFRRRLPILQREEPDLPTDVQDKLSDRLSDGLSTAGSMGIVAKPREFQRMYIRAIGKPGLAGELDAQRLMFRTGAPPADDFHLSGNIIPRILSALLPMMGRRSALTPSIGKRTIIMISCEPKEDEMRQECCSELDHPLMDKVSSAYSAYRRDLLYKSASLVKQAAFVHPEIHQALYGDEVLEMGLVKEGADMMESIIGMMTSTYFNEAYLNEPVSPFVEENCNLAGLEKAAGLAVLGGVA